jgi:hypothetical protein
VAQGSWVSPIAVCNNQAGHRAETPAAEDVGDYQPIKKLVDSALANQIEELRRAVQAVWFRHAHCC